VNGAETAVELVAEVFEVQRWDAPMVHLPDRAAVALFLRGRGLPLDDAKQAADQYPTPLQVTKRGVLIWATTM